MCEHTKSPLPNFFDSGLNAYKYWLNPHFNGYIIKEVDLLIRVECFEVIAGIFPIQGELKCSDFVPGHVLRACFSTNSSIL